jgi:anhydro-N-acetylmuramic acid kinase
MELLKQKLPNRIIVPGKLIVDYKEALIFAFLGLLRLENQINCLRSVTGAQRNSIGGAVYLGKE